VRKISVISWSGILCGALVVASLAVGATRAFAATPLDGATLAKFVDPLPIPRVMAPVPGGDPSATFYEIAMTEFKQKLHRDLPETTVWGYDGSYPGPTIEARTNEHVKVKWVNNLPLTPLLPIDPTIVMGGLPDVRNVVHLHGGHVPPESDGNPDAWFTPGNFAVYDYPNLQQAATLWYHDHANSITRLNVCAGLEAFYIIRDDVEDSLNLPKGAFEIPLVIQDRAFNTDGSLNYPSEGVTAVHPVWVPEFFGDVAMVNGKAFPFLDVQPRKYRFRILNGSNARFIIIRIPGIPKFFQIGSDGGLLPKPVRVRELLLAPAERVDIVVDFSKVAGKTLIMTNNAPAPFPGGGDVALPELMQFRVSSTPVADDSSLPKVLRPLARIPENLASNTRDVTLEETLDPVTGNPLHGNLNGLRWEDAVTENPKLGSTEIWNIVNLTGDAHPIHVHLVEFQVLDWTPFNAGRYAADKAAGKLKPLKNYLTGKPLKPIPSEAGWKDTVKAFPGMVTRIIMTFKDFSGKYVWHCHILEHEDNDMMRPLEVLP